MDTLTAEQIEQNAKAAGLTVRQLCEKAGVSHTSFYRWRTGQRGLTLTTYHRLCDVLRDASAG